MTPRMASGGLALLCLLLSAPLSAATWSELQTLPPGAALLLPAGDALWIAGPPGAPPELRDARGLRLQPIRQDGAWVLPPQAASVWLSSAAGEELQIRLQDSSAEGRRWIAWEQDLRVALRAGARGPGGTQAPGGAGPLLPEPPWGGPDGTEAAMAALRLHAETLTDPGLRQEAIRQEIAQIQPFDSLTWVSAGAITSRGAPDRPAVPMEIEGPAVLSIQARPTARLLPDGRLEPLEIPPGAEPGAGSPQVVRFGLALSMDGEALRPLAAVSSGAIPWTMGRVVVPAGRHWIGWSVVGAEVEVTAAIWQRRPSLLDRPVRPETWFEQAAAELLAGRVSAALAGFRRLSAEPGIIGAVSLLRLLERSPDPAERAAALRALVEAAPVDGAGWQQDVRARAAAAALAAPEGLPEAEVLALLLEARGLSRAGLAAWTGRLPGSRSAGWALLEQSAPWIEEGPSSVIAGARALALSSRMRPLPLRPAGGAAPGAEPGAAPEAPPELLSAEGPGVPRLLLSAASTEPGAQQAEVLLPVLPFGRQPLLRMQAAGPVRYRVDGRARVSAAGGVLDEAVAPGLHVVTVESGELLLMDGALGVGGLRRYGIVRSALPATWLLPGAGVPAELQVEVAPGSAPGALSLSFDDGSSLELAPDAQGALPRAAAPAGARSVTVRGTGGPIRLLMRGPIPPDPAAVPAEAPADPGQAAALRLAALARLAALSGGQPGPEALLERAEILADLGFVQRADRDLERVAAAAAGADAEQRAALAARAAAVRAGYPSPGGRLTAGPDTPEAAAAALAAIPAVLPAVPAGGAPGVLPAVPAGGAPGGLPATAEGWAALLAAHPDWSALRELAGEQLLAAGDLVAAWAVSAPVAGGAPEPSPALLDRTGFSRVSRVELSGGLLEIPRMEMPPSASPGDAVRRALLGLPAGWAEGSYRLLRSRGPDGVRTQGGQVELELFCRDEQGPGRACPVEIRVDGARERVEVPEGTVLRWARALAPGDHLTEIHSVGVGQALGVRAWLDGRLLPPAATAGGFEVRAGSELQATLAGPVLLRVEVADRAPGGPAGSVEVRIGSTVRTGRAGEVLLIPVMERGPLPVRVRALAGPGEPGRAAVGLSVGTLLAAPPSLDLPPVAAWEDIPPDPGALALIAAAAGHPAAALELQGAVSLLGSVSARARPWWGEGWGLAEAAALRRSGAWWWSGAARVGAAQDRLSRAAPVAGAALSAAWVPDRGWLRLDLEGWAGGAALRGDVTLSGRYGWALRPDLGLWLDGALVGRAVPADPGTADPWLWSGYDADHPAQAGVGATLVGAPLQEVRLWGGAEGWSNAPGGGGDTPLDRLHGEAGAALLARPGSVWRLEGTMEVYLRDGDRARGYVRPGVAAGLDQGIWASERASLRLEPELAWSPGVGEWSAALGLSLLHTPARGLLDLAPGSVRWRDARGAP